MGFRTSDSSEGSDHPLFKRLLQEMVTEVSLLIGALSIGHMMCTGQSMFWHMLGVSSCALAIWDLLTCDPSIYPIHYD